ncbi:NAD(P)-binding domain-containing protein [Limosilactobacillus sp. STM2_1]|uniref:NAD(P)-binding domain-containing protein n=1 Tax=Limosilactobacillus rudii TaxID=2759755 RepID=A0A7W3YMS3_9LACO|nr:NAD-binding protein [Limosilactobacillus rudii]MBB1079771.1 NAD(P)-binding domain-containing protein [Limosilactobacillus rudii]MBB1097769.1 NAD(P)-binding domain-containing protein [Limosilactobacillus rudii]MCD7134850.1 NAD(P)-binding domain-containing protein [Limosilactobacillus rudii]
MRKIGIIGLGHVGRMLANQLVMNGKADELVLIDKNDQLAVAVQADLNDAQTVLDTYTKIIIQDYAVLADADILVTAFGKSELLRQQPMAELETSYRQAKQVGQQIFKSDFSGILINLTNPNEAITAVLQQAVGLPQKQVIGIGTVIETARLHRAIAEGAQVATANVTGFVYGQHDGHQVFAWSTVHVNGQPLTAAINGHHLDQSQLKVKANLSNWYTLSGLGYNVSAVTAWTLRIMTAIFADEQLALPVAIYQPQYATYISFPALIGRQGIGNLLLLNLYPLEREEIKSAAETIKHQIESLKNIKGES